MLLVRKNVTKNVCKRKENCVAMVTHLGGYQPYCLATKGLYILYVINVKSKEKCDIKIDYL